MIYLLIFVMCFISVVENHQFTYGENWAEKFPTCNGNAQSPININTELIKFKKVSPLQLTNFDKPLGRVVLENNGHTVAVQNIPRKNRPEVEGGVLKATYRLDHFHFHWGNRRDNGSEHQFNGNRSAMELHMVFFKKEYKHFEAAKKYNDGLMVMAFLLHVASRGNIAMNGLLMDSFNSIRYAGTKIRYDRMLSIQDFVGDIPSYTGGRCMYVSYQGSLTTPPCSEIVTWLVFIDAVPITTMQLREFRKFKDKNEKTIKSNVREPQEINSRKIRMFYNALLQ